MESRPLRGLDKGFRGCPSLRDEAEQRQATDMSGVRTGDIADECEVVHGGVAGVCDTGAWRTPGRGSWWSGVCACEPAIAAVWRAVGTDSGGPRYVQSVCEAAAREYAACACAADWRAAAMCAPRACVLRAMRGPRRVGESAWWYRGWFRGPLAAHPVYRDIRSSECVNPSGMARARIFSVLAGSPRRTHSPLQTSRLGVWWRVMACLDSVPR